MRTADEIKKLAYADTPIDGNHSPSECCFWIRMRYIYKAFAAGLMSKEAARQETKGAENDYRVMCLWESIYDKCKTVNRIVEVATYNYRKAATDENAHKLAQIAADLWSEK